MGLVREAVRADCARMASVYQESLDLKNCCMEVSTSEAAFAEKLAKLGEREALLVIEDDGGTVQGWGAVKAYSDRVGYRVACETSIYLSHSATGLGLGSTLQKALMKRVKSLGYHHIVAKIWADNDGSLRFHERFGYRMVGVQKQVGFLNGRWLDVAILQCVLEDVEPYRPDLA